MDDMLGLSANLNSYIDMDDSLNKLNHFPSELVIQDVATSCGCTTVSYYKESVQPGKETALEVAYKAERPEHFAKTITVYYNAEHSPLTLKISGDAK